MKFNLLDHGYLELVETWGSDQSIIEAARMSTDKGFLGWGPIQKFTCPVHGVLGTIKPFHVYQSEDPADYLAWIHGGTCGSTCEVEEKPGDEKLLRYLWEHDHTTPFEMAGITIEVKAPIMVFREWHRHRVPFGYNEMSARYVPLPDENYVPEAHDVVLRMRAARLSKNKQEQNSIESEIDDATAAASVRNWLDDLENFYRHGQRLYEQALEAGIPKELARLPVPVGRYSRMRATSNLRGWLGFMKLRAAPTAQKEIRVYAEALGEIIREKFPRTWVLYADKT